MTTIVHSEALPFLQAQPEASVDLIVTDPPYNIGKASWDTWPSDGAYLAWLRAHVVAMRRVLKPNGSLYLFAAPQFAARVEVMVGEAMHVLNQIVWEKSTGNANWRAEKEAVRSYLPNTERIIFAEQYASDAYAMGEAGYEAAERGLKTSLFAAPIAEAMAGTGTSAKEVTEAIGAYGTVNHGGAVSNWLQGYNIPTKEHYQAMRTFFNSYNVRTDNLRQEYDYLRQEYDYLRQEYDYLRQEYDYLRRPFALTAQDPYTDVWRFRPVPYEEGKHVCEKPLPLLRHMIATSSRPGAIVLDCFCGSGATLDAARQEGRQWLGCDADAAWAARSQQRLAAPYTLSLFDREARPGAD